ncbi:MAG TPA: TetR/AcrR family transcriptional regulator, partial [Spongiibacteraceae bacterium]|nr:TetR/AcrR family transcriptional regulator [Spongiibacteraceae bacterium]
RLVRWGEGKRADPETAREKILEAAWRCYNRSSVQSTTMEEIVREAKVSRQTVYRHFRGHEEVVSAVILSRVALLLLRLEDVHRQSTGFAEFLVESMVSIAEQVQHSPMFTILQKQEAHVLNRVYQGSSGVFAAIGQCFRPYFDSAQAAGELLDDIDFEPFMTWTLHVLSGYVIAVSPLHESSEWRRMLWRFLVPLIVKAEAIPADKCT